MKWWGWGRDDVAFTHEDKPYFAPFVQEVLGVDVAQRRSTPPDFATLDVPAPRLPDALVAALEGVPVSLDARDRVEHGRGKSVRDLVLNRRGDLGRLPDAVVRPADEAQVEQVLRAALEHDAVVIAFGGGSSISGSLDAPRAETRPVLSVDVSALDRVLDVDASARLARVQAGVFGPALEEQLQARGWTAGHYPDSFTHSTLGGWIATRSSGMQSDRYGDVADITRGLRVVTPNGLLATRPVPVTSTGPSVREMILGSEGRLGVITEATIQVHRLPDERVILGYLFPDWPSGLAAMQAISHSEAAPSVTRVSDAPETAFSFATRKKPSLIDSLQSKALMAFLSKRKGYDTDNLCLSFIGFEGSPAHVKAQRKAVGRIVARHGGLCIGSGPGALYDQKKFDTPYIRDFLLDRGTIADVSETAAPWSVLPALYDRTMGAARGAFADLGVRGYVMCHLSHSYHAGACLYFTFALVPSGRRDDLEEYDAVKGAIQQSFVDNGGTLSHHHAVGTEHSAWLEQDLSAPGVAMIRALLDGTDPGHNLNPGKIVEP